MRRSQQCISYTKSLILSTVACNATLARHLCYVDYNTPFPRNVSLGRLCRNLLFSCFVDFRKAFDCIPRQKLFDKLGKGVPGRFLDVLISMYSNDKSTVKIDNKLTQSFTFYAGVKQGCMLSPTICNIYLNDLPKFLNTASSTDILLGDKSINCLIFGRSSDLL